MSIQAGGVHSSIEGVENSIEIEELGRFAVDEYNKREVSPPVCNDPQELPKNMWIYIFELLEGKCDPCFTLGVDRFFICDAALSIIHPKLDCEVPDSETILYFARIWNLITEKQERRPQTKVNI